MKIVVYNPHWHDRTAGIHDYIVEFLRQCRPAIQISSMQEFLRWQKFIYSKKLPKLWDYTIGTQTPSSKFDCWICFAGNAYADQVVFPSRFPGLKIYHMMDYGYNIGLVGSLFKMAKVDFLLGYTSFDEWCPAFCKSLPDYIGKLIPWPFGYNKRFSNTLAWDNRENKCSVMGAIHTVGDDLRLQAYYRLKGYKKGMESHPVRSVVRDNLAYLNSVVESYLPDKKNPVRLDYDSPYELNRHKMFLNDSARANFPPARTYEGCASGAVMVCRKHPCFSPFGFKHGQNCIMIDAVESAKMIKVTLEEYLREDSELFKIQQQSLMNIDKFSHEKLGQSLSNALNGLFHGNIHEVKGMFR